MSLAICAVLAVIIVLLGRVQPTLFDRARAFAMHGIAQYRQLKNRHGQGWHSLWTGDLGLAIYLWECITIEAGFPTMDFF